VQSCHDQVSSFSTGDGKLDGFQVTHLTYQKHVGVFTERCPQSVVEGMCVLAQLTLVYDGFFVIVQVLDRVFDGDDVFRTLLVDVVDNRRQSGGLTRPGGPGDEKQTTRPGRYFLETGGRPSWRMVGIFRGI